jgi:hypothetical protein
MDHLDMQEGRFEFWSSRVLVKQGDPRAGILYRAAFVHGRRVWMSQPCRTMREAMKAVYDLCEGDSGRLRAFIDGQSSSHINQVFVHGGVYDANNPFMVTRKMLWTEAERVVEAEKKLADVIPITRQPGEKRPAARARRNEERTDVH